MVDGCCCLGLRLGKAFLLCDETRQEGVPSYELRGAAATGRNDFGLFVGGIVAISGSF